MAIDDPNNPLFSTAPLPQQQFPVPPPQQHLNGAERAGGGRRHAAFDPSAPEDDLDALLGPAAEAAPPAPVEPPAQPATVEPPAQPAVPAETTGPAGVEASTPFAPQAEETAGQPPSPLDLGSAPPSMNGTRHSAPAEAFGANLSDGLRAEMLALLGRSGGQLRAVFDQYRTGVTLPAAIAASGAASEPVAAGMVTRIRTLLGEPWTSGPGRSRPVAATIRGLLRAPDLSREARQYLTGLRTQLLELADSDAGRADEQAQLESNSVVLQRELRTANGVFVYTYPHYWRHPYIADANRLLLKLEMTAQGAWQRVLDQARSSGAPEDPVLLRLYVSPDPAAAERVIHRLLEAADHTRHATHAGAREWFATTLEFLDEIARALSFEIKAGAEPVF